MQLAQEFKNFITENFCKPKNDTTLANGKQRIAFIDLAKGVCIILVVLLHSGYLGDVTILRALRMPLYFVLSGLFFKDYGNIINFVIKKINRLLIPFFFFFIAYLFVELILAAITGSYEFSQIISEITLPFNEPDIKNIPIWFLLCLFEVNLFYYIIEKSIKNNWIKLSVVLLSGFIGLYLSNSDIYIPLFMSTAFSALPFFFAGYLLRSSPILYRTSRDSLIFMICMALLIAVIAYCLLNRTSFIEFRTNQYTGNLLEIYLMSIILVVSLLLLCKAISWLPIVSYVGRYSVIVLGIHVIYRDFAYLLLYLCLGRPITSQEFVPISLFLCWISIPILKKLFPYFTAQKDLIKPINIGQTARKATDAIQ